MKTELIPVIHILNLEQVIININIGISCGVNKFFLIGHVASNDEVLNIAYFVKKQYPNQSQDDVKMDRVKSGQQPVKGCDCNKYLNNDRKK
jgi:hypothetical protein